MSFDCHIPFSTSIEESFLICNECFVGLNKYSFIHFHFLRNATLQECKHYIPIKYKYPIIILNYSNKLYLILTEVFSFPGFNIV